MAHLLGSVGDAEASASARGLTSPPQAVPRRAETAAAAAVCRGEAFEDAPVLFGSPAGSSDAAELYLDATSEGVWGLPAWGSGQRRQPLPLSLS